MTMFMGCQKPYTLNPAYTRQRFQLLNSDAVSYNAVVLPGSDASLHFKQYVFTVLRRFSV